MVEPILRWAGGKRQFLDEILRHLPSNEEFDHYFEPFLGGGSVYFALEPSEAYLNDVNSKLISFYQCVGEDPEHIITHNEHIDAKIRAFENSEQTYLSSFLDEDDKSSINQAELTTEKSKQDLYYSLREEFNNLRENKKSRDRFREAALFFFLNRTCWNGLYRTNQNGDFNVPVGEQWTETSFYKRRIKQASSLLQTAKICDGDYIDVLDDVSENDLVFFDPPYPTDPDERSFQGYHHTEFGLDRHRELAEHALDLNEQGAFVMITNSPTAELLDMYEEIGIVDEFEMKPLEGTRMINSKSDKRTDIGSTDIIVTNYKQGMSHTIDGFYG